MNKLQKILLIQHELIENIMKYDKEFKPKEYNENKKKAIKSLLRMERKEINDLL